MGKYSKVLLSYQRPLEIKKEIVLPDHCNLAAPYNNVALVHDNMGECSEALSYYEKKLEISQQILSNHLVLATSYNNTDPMYDNMVEYSKALSYLQKTLDIRLKALPSSHPYLISIGSLIEKVKKKS